MAKKNHPSVKGIITHLEMIVKQSPFKGLGEIHRVWTAAGVRVPQTDREIQEMGHNSFNFFTKASRNKSKNIREQGLNFEFSLG